MSGRPVGLFRTDARGAFVQLIGSCYFLTFEIYLGITAENLLSQLLVLFLETFHALIVAVARQGLPDKV